MGVQKYVTTSMAVLSHAVVGVLWVFSIGLPTVVWAENTAVTIGKPARAHVNFIITIPETLSLEIGDKVQIVDSGTSYNYTRDGSWGYVRSLGSRPDIEFHHLTGRSHSLPVTFDIYRQHLEIIESPSLCEDRILQSIKKQVEAKYEITKFFEQIEKYKLIEKQLKKIFK